MLTSKLSQYCNGFSFPLVQDGGNENDDKGVEKEKDHKEENGGEKEKKREKEVKSSSPSSKKDSGSKKKTKLISDLFGDEHESAKVKKASQGQS